MTQPAQPPPDSILIVGAGVFGLSTTLSLLHSPNYHSTQITLLDTHAPTDTSVDPSDSFNPHAASIDTSRIIRADYANPLYTRLASEAHQHWRNGFPKPGIYHESGLAIVAEKGARGWEYIEKSRRNVNSAGEESSVRGLDSAEEIKAALKTEGSSGSAGYINYSDGWADAAAAMAEMRRQVSQEARRQGRNNLWKRGKAVSLLYSPSATTTTTPTPRRKVLGVLLSSNSPLPATLTILATGAWTASLLNLHARASATAQTLAYMPLTPTEHLRLSTMPIILNLSTGLFAIPPSPSSPTSPTLKIARHSYGYQNPTPIKSQPPYTASLPSPTFSPIPAEGLLACRTFLHTLIPWLPSSREFESTRLCWYMDTHGGDFIVDYVGGVEGLFVATGGSGHAFKFAPVLGGLVVKAVEGRLEKEYREMWKWGEDGDVVGEVFEGCEDGSRGGRKGMVLEEEWERGGDAGGGGGRERGSRL